MSKILPKYLSSYLTNRCDLRLFNQLPKSDISSVDIVVVIPAYKEDFETLLNTLKSLEGATLAAIKVAVLILINYKDTDSEEVIVQSHSLQKQLLATNMDIPSHVFVTELSGKHKGVGLARKMLMDTALLWFEHLDNQGLIVNLDADTIIQENYFLSIQKYFKDNEEMEAASIHFEHPYDNEAIIQYELHLRYFINMQRLAGLPYAIQTIGSAMVVRSWAYAKEGGMNLRQAGEDFYFLHKYSKNMTLGEIHDTTVIPSGRISDRVPFGTGKAVRDHWSAPELYKSYNSEGFMELGKWVKQVEMSLAKSEGKRVEPDYNPLQGYLDSVNYSHHWSRIVHSTHSPARRVKAFFAWFDAFKLMKYLHYIRDIGIKDVELKVVVEDLLKAIGVEDAIDPLSTLRKVDTVSDYYPQWRAAFISRLSKMTAS